MAVPSVHYSMAFVEHGYRAEFNDVAGAGERGPRPLPADDTMPLVSVDAYFRFLTAPRRF